MREWKHLWRTQVPTVGDDESVWSIESAIEERISLNINNASAQRAFFFWVLWLFYYLLVSSSHLQKRWTGVPTTSPTFWSLLSKGTLHFTFFGLLLVVVCWCVDERPCAAPPPPSFHLSINSFSYRGDVLPFARGDWKRRWGHLTSAFTKHFFYAPLKRCNFFILSLKNIYTPRYWKHFFCWPVWRARA